MDDKDWWSGCKAFPIGTRGRWRMIPYTLGPHESRLRGWRRAARVWGSREAFEAVVVALRERAIAIAHLVASITRRCPAAA